MLKKLRIKNFKAWKDTGEISMTPITLFFGANSSGKSSIGQFLMLLKQTVESSDRKAVLFHGDDNSAVQLGSYKDMVHNGDKGKPIEFEYEWTLDRNLDVINPITKDKYSGNELSFHATVMLDKIEAPIVDNFHYTLSNSGKSNFKISISKQKKNGRSKYSAEAEQYNLQKSHGRFWGLSSPVHFYGFPADINQKYQNAGFMLDLEYQIKKLFSSLYYLGPLRNKAERLYNWTGYAPEDVGHSGQNVVATLLATKEKNINFARGERHKSLEEIIALELKKMNLIDDFKIETVSEKKQYEVKVMTPGIKKMVDLPDVGFGISQVLPVLVQCFCAPPQSIILMEQPEIHLHPSAQSTLADVMIDAIDSREDGKHKNLQLIIETHSEHFLRRLQRRIAEKKNLREKITAYFVDHTQHPAQLNRLIVDDYGNIKNWPDNFFGNEMKDIIEQSKAAIKKKKDFSNNDDIKNSNE